MTIRVLAIGNNVTTQDDHRALIASLATSAGAISNRDGLFPSSPSPATLSNVSAMVVGVGAFRAIVAISGPDALVNSDSTINLTFDPGEAGVTRTDRIILRIYNNASDGSGRNEAAVEYLKGQSSGSATALPANSLLLWEIPVPAGASSGNGGINFTGIAVDKRVYTAAAGGVVIVTNLSEVVNPYKGMVVYNQGTNFLYIYDGSQWRGKGQMAVASFSNLSNISNPEDGTVAWVRDLDIMYVYNGTVWEPVSRITVTNAQLASIGGPYEGLKAYVTDTKLEYTYTGGSWVRDRIIKNGETTITSGGFRTVTFGYTFPSPPAVFVTAKTGASSQLLPTFMVTSITTTQCSIRVDVTGGSTTEAVPIMWMATV